MARHSGPQQKPRRRAPPRKGPGSKPNRRARQSGGRVSRLIWFSMSTAVWLAVAVAGVVAWYAYDLPDIARLDRAGIRKPVLTVEAADGSVLARYGQVHGQSVEVRKLPPYLPRAFLAIEDTRFYSHPGVDVFGILRAAFRNLSAGAVREGGSTITQQLAKNLFLTRARTIRRKIRKRCWRFGWNSDSARIKSSVSTSTGSISAAAPTASTPRRGATSTGRRRQ